MTETEQSRTEWLEWHLAQVPFQILHMRELAEGTLKAQALTERTTGSKDVERLPFNASAADDADLLYATLVLFAQEVQERTGNPAPRPVRARQWRGQDEVQGLPSCRPDEAFALSTEIVRYLTASAHQIAHDGELHDAPEQLVDVIRKMRARYPRAEPTFRAYRPRPCPQPVCGERMITPVYDAEGLAGYRCDNCEAQWDRDGQPVDHIEHREQEGPDGEP